MYYTETKEQASEILRLALGAVAQQGVAPTPINYTLWYEYFSGTKSLLKKAMDNHLQQGKPLSEQLHQELYRQFIADGDRLANRKILQEFQRVIDEVANHVKEAGGNMSQQGGKLKTLAGRLENENDLDAVRSIVDFLIMATRQILASSDHLETRLAKATSEVDALRGQMVRLKEQAVTDALTGLVNRWGLEKLLKREMQISKKEGKSLCVIMADIDNFKQINDTYGHLVGDNVIKMFAATLTDFVKGRDLVVRYGGEEFLMVLPDTPISGALSLSGNLKTFLETMKWRRKGTGKTLGKISLSFGVAKYRYDESMESLIHRADQALYHSKQNGRNRVTSEDELNLTEIRN
ncbi:MAG: GGDEF domain-containing protein [Desulfobacterales bacterium]|jgi:diguanylate cyclase|nr:GGDEF domain-containing protein [Desulfobacterales bacterium]